MKPPTTNPVLLPTFPSRSYNSVGALVPDTRPIFEFLDVPDERAVNQHRHWVNTVKLEREGV